MWNWVGHNREEYYFDKCCVFIWTKKIRYGFGLEYFGGGVGSTKNSA